MAFRKRPDRVDDEYGIVHPGVCVQSECAAYYAGNRRACGESPRILSKDPRDRLIGATALVEGAGLVTHDRGIAKSGLVPVIW